MANAHYREMKPTLRLKVRRRAYGQEQPEEWKELPVSGMTLHFNAHSMPEASFAVPPGRNPASRTSSTIAELKDELTTTWELQAEMTVTGWLGSNRLSNQTFTVWRGVLAGVGYISSAGAFQYSVNSAHWLSYLDSASCTSGGVVKNSPYNLRAKYSSITNSKSSLTGEQSLRGVVNGVPSDLWTGAILPMLSAVLTPVEDTNQGDISLNSGDLWKDTISNVDAVKLGPGVTSASAIRELEAGNRVALKILGGPLNAKYNVGWMAQLPTLNDPTKVNSSGLPVANLGWFTTHEHYGGVLGVIASIIAHAIEAQSPWEKLLYLGQQFFFRVLPCVESAAIFPYLPVTSSQDVWRVLGRNDYVLLNGSGFVPSSWAGVGVYGQSSTNTNSPIPGGANQTVQGQLAGGYLVGNRGKVAFYPLPPFMTSVAVGLRVRDVIENNPNVSKDILKLRQTAGNNYAQMLWSEQAFAGRTIRLQTPLRFDIAPGSTIILRGLDINANSQISSDHTKVLYGMVSGVRVVLDAIGPSAVCELTVTHLRTPAENDLGPEQHPLYYPPASSALDYPSGNPLTPIGDDDLKAEAP